MRIKTIGYGFIVSVFLIESIFLSAAAQRVNAQAQSEHNEQTIKDQSYLVISAVQITGGTGKTHEDYIELFNPSSQPFDLKGYKLVKRTAAGTSDGLIKSWDTETIVPSGHFYLWANSGFLGISVTPDAISSGTLADNNGIALRSIEEGIAEPGVLLDSLAWGSTLNGFSNKSSENPSANESLSKQNLFEIEGGYAIQPSHPRNSSEIAENPDHMNDESLPPEDETDGDAEIVPTEETFDEDENQNEASEQVARITITELLPNPLGSDAGFEKIELHNESDVKVNLEGYILDDVNSQESLSTNAYYLLEQYIEPGEYIVITVPAGKMSLNNSGGDVLSLFEPNYGEISTIFYEESAPEGKSYSYFASGWDWSDSTFGTYNGQPPIDTNSEHTEDESDEDSEENNSYNNNGLEITEIYPQPTSSNTEYIEIFNAGTESAQLGKITLYIGDRKKLLPEYVLDPGKYYVVEQGSLPIQLRNSGQTVVLKEDNFVINEVSYEVAVEGSSFAKFEDGFLWTQKLTKGAENILEIPEQIKKEVASEANKTAVKKAMPATPKATSKSNVKTLTTNTKTSAVSNTEAAEKSEDQSNSMQQATIQNEQNQKESLGKIIAMGAAAIAGGVAALYKLVFAAASE